MKLDQDYSRDSFLAFLGDFLPDFKPDVREVSLPSAVKTISKGYQLGVSSELDLSIFQLEHDGSHEKRVGLATDGFRIMKDSASYQALVAYISKSGEWRLSFMTASPEISEGGKVVTKLSNPRRFSFALGANAKVATPTKFLQQKGIVSNLEDLKSRFSVEVVNKEFYSKIAELYTELVGGVRGEGKNAKTFPGVLRLPSVEQHSAGMQQFAVRLIGRLVFCWFLREKKGIEGRPLIPMDVLSFNAAKSTEDYYHEALEPLFFQVLNRQMDARKEQFHTGRFSEVPYLNGGLFSPQDDDYYSSNESRQAVYHNTVTVPDSWIRSFFNVLEQYNFTVDENTSVDVDLSIDPEMLGRIFENLLAEINPETGESARKSTGSFYTPRQIVEYMVDQSLLAHLEQKTGIDRKKLEAVISYDLSDDIEYPLNQADQQGIVGALSALTILDPACGSGAFPIGILQKVVYMLQQIDPEAQLWFQHQISDTPPEVRRLVEREFKNKNFDYIRKLGIIRQSIYGVDIQPIATEIARLRCFLTLIVDERVDDKLPNRGIEPLPNLDFKFVTANSLIKLPAAHTGQINLFDDQDGIAELKTIRSEYFTASASERDQIKYRFAQVQKSMFQKMIAGNGYAELTQKLSAWDPFTHQATDWFDEEWMFGIANGFNVVIANPPYIDSEGMVNVGLQYLREYIAEHYETTKGNWDIYIAFFEKGLSLLEDNGVLVYISPDKWISKPFGDELRKSTIKNLYSVLKAGRTVFESAKVDSIITIFTRQEVEKLGVLTYENERIVSRKDIEKSIMTSPYQLDYLFSDYLEFLTRLGSIKGKLSDVAECENACATSDAYKLKPFIIDAASGFMPESQLKVINTGTISKYTNRWGINKMTYLKDKYLHPVVDKSQFLESFANSYGKKSLKPKIIIKGLNLLDGCLDIKGEVVPGKTTLIITSRSLEDLKLLLGIINSKLAIFYIKERYPASSYNQGIGFTKDMINSFPLPEIPPDAKKALISLVDEILGSEQVSQELMGQVDKLVYTLYGLTAREIQVIES